MDFNLRSASIDDGRGRLLIVEIRGEFDLAIADRLRRPLFGVLAGPAPIVAFDLCDCTYVDSVALGLISDAQEWTRRGSAALALICPGGPHPALTPLRQSGLHETIQVFPSREIFTAFIEQLEGPARTAEVWKCLSGGVLTTSGTAPSAE